MCGGEAEQTVELICACQLCSKAYKDFQNPAKLIKEGHCSEPHIALAMVYEQPQGLMFLTPFLYCGQEKNGGAQGWDSHQLVQGMYCWLQCESGVLY